MLTIVFDPVAAKTQSADSTPRRSSISAPFSTGDKGDTTPGTVTFYIDHVVVVSAN